MDYIPSFYLGDRLNIVRDEFMNDIVSFLLTVFIFVVGFIIIIYSWIVTKNKANKYDLIYLGIFAVLLSIWFVINMPVVNMIIDVGTIFTYTSYILCTQNQYFQPNYLYVLEQLYYQANTL